MQTSVVIPTLNEEPNIVACLDSLASLGLREVVVADGGSEDRTVALAISQGASVVTSPRGRGRQCNAGAAATTGDLLLFLHADCRLPANARESILDAFADPRVGWGAFRHRIESPSWSLRIIETADNLRASWFRRPYGDQGLVIRRSVWEAVGGYPETPILEDVLLAKQLRQVSRYRQLDAAISTDARRWERKGVVKTTAVNWSILAGAACGVPLERLARWYRGP